MKKSKSNRKRSGNPKLNLESQSWLIVEEPIASFFQERKSDLNVGFRDYPRHKIGTSGRWLHIAKIHVLLPAMKQGYLASRLDVPHYQVGMAERQEYVEAASKFAEDHDMENVYDNKSLD